MVNGNADVNERSRNKKKRTNNSGHANATEAFPTHVDLLVKGRFVSKSPFSTEHPPKVIDLLCRSRLWIIAYPDLGARLD